MHSLGSYHLSGPYSRPLIVQVDLSHVSDPRDVLSEAASNGRPQRTASARQTARTRGQMVSSRLAHVSGRGWSWGSGCGLGSNRRKAILYIPARCRLLSRRREPSSELPARMQGRDSMRRGAGRLAGTIGNAAASFAGWQQLKGSISRMNCLAYDSRMRT